MCSCFGFLIGINKINMDKKCESCTLEPVVCRKCKSHLLSHEVEYLGILLDVAGYCPNEKCDFFEVLVI